MSEDSHQNTLDDLVFNFSDVKVSNENPNDSTKPHPKFYSYYKNKGKGQSSAQDRRLRVLERQKKRRDDFLSVARALVKVDREEELLKDEMDETFDEDEEADRMDTTNSPKKIKNPKKTYKNQLMLSEWLVDIPEDFHSKWLTVLCPEGKRNLVIAGNGKTKYYSRNGIYLGSFPSVLPGGNRKRGSGKNTLTLLDAIYSEKTSSFFVLDVLIWDGNSYYNCDTEFRFFWLRTKLNELPENPSKKTGINPYPFIAAPFFDASESSIKKAFSSPISELLGDDINLDGILFYHKEALYFPGPTPLVGWLKGYMIEELLKISVHESFSSNRPNNYASMKSAIFIQDPYSKGQFTFRLNVEKNKPVDTGFNSSGGPLTAEKIMEF